MADIFGGLGNGGAIGFDSSSIPIVGAVFSGDEDAAANARFGAVANRYRQLKPEIAQSYSNSLNTQLGAYAPANNMLGAMAGNDPSMQIDLGAMGRSPVTPGMLNTPDTTQKKKDSFFGGFIEEPFKGPLGPLEHLGSLLGL
jgi:hypothetical protein